MNKTLWDMDKVKLECEACGVNCDLYIIEDCDILCQNCAEQEPVEFDDPNDQ